MARAGAQTFSKSRFNKLIMLFHRFSDEYNKSKGDVWPPEQAELVKRAFKDLEQTPSGQRPQRSWSLTEPIAVQ